MYILLPPVRKKKKKKRFKIMGTWIFRFDFGIKEEMIYRSHLRRKEKALTLHTNISFVHTANEEHFLTESSF